MLKDAVRGSADRLEMYRRASNVSVLGGIQQVFEGDSGNRDRDSRRGISMDRW